MEALKPNLSSEGPQAAGPLAFDVEDVDAQRFPECWANTEEPIQEITRETSVGDVRMHS